MSDSATLGGGRLHATEERADDWYGTALSLAGDGVYQLDLDGRFVAVNDVILDVTGYDAGDLLGEHVSLLLDEDDLRDLQRVVGDLVAGERAAPVTHPGTVRTADGEDPSVEFRFGLLREGGAVTGTVGVVRDLTGRWEHQRRLRERAERVKRQRDDLRAELDEVFSRVTDAVFALDRQRRFTYVNERAAEYLGREESELIGKSVEEVAPETVDGPFWEPFQEAMETQRPVSFEAYSEAFDTWFQANAYPSETGLSVYYRDVSERVERERTLQAQRERLARLNDVNAMIQDLSHAIVGADTREEIERVVCERLAAEFEFAWFGEVRDDVVAVRTAAGLDGAPGDVTVPVDAADCPVALAARTGTVRTVEDVLADSCQVQFHEAASEYGYRSSVAVPVTYEGVLYGVLNVLAAEPGVFEDDVGEVVGRLGRVLGHAINAVETRRALVGDEVTELQFHVPDVLSARGVDVEAGYVEFESILPTGDGSYVTYGTATPDGIETLRSLVETVPHYRDLTVREASPRSRVTLQLAEPPLASLVASLGGRIESTVLEGDAVDMTVHLPYDADVRGFVEQVRAEYADAEVLAQRRTSRPDGTVEAVGMVLDERLTERQRVALEAAYVAGFFEWPREVTGEEVAESMGVSPATFHQHLRAAERRILTELFDSLAG